MTPRLRIIPLVLLTVLLIPAVRVAAFTQRAFGIGFGDAVPMGHEWLTRTSAIELIGFTGSPQEPDVSDPRDPRRNWTRGRATNTDLSSPAAKAEVARIKSMPISENTYRSRYKLVLDAILGQRWVDIGGYNALTSKNCFDSVSQEAVEVQHDHFMRRWDDREAVGGVNSARSSRDRFVEYFVAAATAPRTEMSAYDGGAVGSTAVSVDRNYFLFGRAVHMFQDSFSTEHTVRVEYDDDGKLDNYVLVRQVKAYMCATTSEQHSHSQDAVLDYSSGDVIWKERGVLGGWETYKPSAMKVPPLVAMEASKDLWAAFIRTMALRPEQRESAARAEATKLARTWLWGDEDAMLAWYDKPAHRGKTFVLPAAEDPTGESVRQCMIKSEFGDITPEARAKKLIADQRVCLYNALPWAGYSDLFDTQLHLWFAWRWRNLAKLETPDSSYKIPDRPADTGVRVRIRSVGNGELISTLQKEVKPDALVYCRAGAYPLDLIAVDTSYRAIDDPLLFLSHRAITNAVKLYAPAPLDPTTFKTAAYGDAITIQLQPNLQYMWLSDESPYLTKKGDPKNANARWKFEPVPVR
ncbi:MAG TPA: hemolysin D [Thermoanaerobaculia bacterium]|nr:hemolysin D [Thermoanaerobaculia bacterium]